VMWKYSVDEKYAREVRAKLDQRNQPAN